MEHTYGIGQLRSPDKRIDGRLLAYSIGGTALALTGIWAGKKLAEHAKPALLRLLDRMDMVEHEGHPQTAGIFKLLAESFGVDVHEEHMAYWQNMLTVARALDTIVDDEHSDSLDKEFVSVLSGETIPGVSDTEAQKFRDTLRDASDERREIIRSGTKIETIAKTIRGTQDGHEMLRLRAEEGEIFARIMTLDNPEQASSIEAFNKWFIGFGKAGYELDSFVDLAGDFKNGVVSVEPTLANYLVIGKAAARDSYRSLSRLPRRTVAALALAGVKKTARKTLRSRLDQ